MTTNINFASDAHSNAQLVNAFIALQLIGQFGLFVIVLTAVASPNVKRNPTWYTFCVGWILSCVSYTFVFLIGQQDAPTFGACVTQAAGIYAAPVLTSLTTLSFAMDMLLDVRAASAHSPLKRSRTITIALLVIPFFVWIVMFVGFLVFGVKNPSLVGKGPNGTYCDLNTFIPSKITGLISVLATIVILLIQGYIGVRLFKNRHLLQDRRLAAMAIRIMIFSLLGALALGIGFAYVLFSAQGPEFDIITALLPIGSVIIFGTHFDLFDVWLFWRQPRSSSSSQTHYFKSASITSVPTP
ncbi:hypothetical protein R3P38DRAFT_2828586 [Favolaschia claudopus]|uniref:G-protein coupled receptors family 3 profile domain-containing protein n=1 Tax=Favolaschia claudopus TaxID=2862362 RepID=A0AAW0EAF2_9AGAR